MISSAELEQLEEKFDDSVETGSASGGDEECVDGDKCDDNPESTFTITGPSTSTEKPLQLTTNTVPNIPGQFNGVNLSTGVFYLLNICDC